MMINQIAEKKEMLRILRIRLPKLTDSLLNKAIQICDEEDVITGHTRKYCYQTQTVQRKQKDINEMFEFVKSLQP